MVLTQKLKETNKTVSPELNPCLRSQLIFDKGAKSTQWGKDSLFNRWVLGKLNKHRAMKLDAYLIPLTENNLKWIKDFNIRPDSIKLEKKMGKELFNTSLHNVWDMTPKAQTKAKIHKWDYTKIKFSGSKRSKKMKKKATEWENIFANHLFES